MFFTHGGGGHIVYTGKSAVNYMAPLMRVWLYFAYISGIGLGLRLALGSVSPSGVGSGLVLGL